VAWLASSGQWKTWIKSIQPHIHGEGLLELGVGPGHLFSSMQNGQSNVIGIDISLKMIKLAKRNYLKGAGRHGTCSPGLIVAASQSLPFQFEIFDTIYATFPTEYITNNETLVGVYRLLKPGGELIVLLAADPNGNNLSSLCLKLLYRLTGHSAGMEAETFKVLNDRLSAFGFIPDIFWEQRDNTRLLFISARKKKKGLPNLT
jgi:ubiquinone/menaquinone biosynthesis C-methylase UbiE